ncbi:phage tail tape measure protein [Ureibacillus sp. FSL W8-0352]|uniref:phage tail tape measure protein n=1 Tax=Ureibacillus sp. FSL W8-0352 TaxID=2954596 RepID=UPI0030F5EFD5
MANGKIKGITIELSGDAAPLEKALKEVDKASRNTSKELNQINRALKFDPENTTLLKQKFDVLQDAIKNTETKLNALKQAQAEVDRQFQSGEIDAQTYRQFQREIEITEGKLKAFRQQAEDIKVKIDSQADTSALDKVKQKLDEVAIKSKEVGDKMSSIGTEMSTKISAPLAAAGAGAAMAATQFDNAAGQIQAALGLTAEEAAKLEEKAKNVWEAGFGESLDEVTNALVRVKQNMHNLDDGEVEKVTQNALLLAKTFDSDVNEVTRAANNLMEGFGLSADEAFDLMTAGAQRGLNFSNELFDNLSEYVPLWSQMGFSAEEMFGVLERGVKSGVYNLDYMNDVMKEFQIRVKDGSKTTSDAFAELSSQTQKVWKDFLDGKATVADVAYAVVGELKSMDDQVLANQIGVGLFGTKWEDLESKAMYAMLGSKEAMEGFEGATQKASDAVEQTFGQRWESFTRTAASSLEPLGNTLLDLAEQWLPKIAGALESVSNWFAELSPFVQQMILIFGALVVAIGPALVIFGQIVSALGALIPLFTSGGAAAPVFGAVISALSGPIGIVVAAIAGLIAIGVALYKNWDEVSAFLKGIWEGIKEAATIVFSAISDYLITKWEEVKTITEVVWNGISTFFSTVWEGIKNIFNTVVEIIKQTMEIYWNSMGEGIRLVWEGIKQYFEGVWELIKNVFLGALLIIIDLLTGNWEDAKKHTEQIWENIKNALLSIWEAIQNIFSGVLEAISGYITTTWDNIKNTTSTVFTTVKNSISTIWNNIKTFVRDTVANIVTTVTNKFAELKNAVTEKMQLVKTTIEDLWNEAQRFFENIDLFQIGKDIIQGLIDGIGSMAEAVWRKVKEIAEGIKETIMKALDIHSPSRVTMSYGVNIGEGLVIGMEKMIEKVYSMSAKLADSVINAQEMLNYNANRLAQGNVSYVNNSVNNSRTFAPVINNYGVSNNDIAIERTLRRLALKYN